ncbi:MAG: DNA polymerase I, partial [Candidatus Omnitrophica bacterium]|nr:DNA polymerase I [Candidatus Omnitrophota bacterium]
MNSLDFFLIDATAFCYRAFYAVRGLATSYGQPTNAIFGFLNILQKMIKEYDPAYLAVCFDVSRDTFRQKKFAEYKVQRPPMPDGLTSQMPYIKELVEAYQITLFEKEGFEADDIIATIVKKAKAMDVAITIVSADKDMLQLVDERTRVLSPAKENDVLYDVEAVKQRFGVGPERICDILALAGDDVDNIPGVPGVGEKTAIDLLKKFQTLEALLAEPEKIAKEKLRAAIIAHKDRIILNKELAALDSAVDVDFSLEKVKRNKPDERKLFRLFKQLEFKSLL